MTKSKTSKPDRAGGARRARGRSRRHLRRQLPQQRRRTAPSLVKVLVASRDIPAGTEGSAVATRRLPEDADRAPPRGRSRLGRERSAADVAGRRRSDLRGRADHAPPVQPRRRRAASSPSSPARSARSPSSASRTSCSPARSPTATTSTSSRPPATTSGRTARDDARRPAGPARPRGARRRRRRTSLAAGEDSHRDARDDRPPGPDDGLGDEDEHLVPRAAADRASEQQQGRASRRCTRSWRAACRSDTAVAEIIGDFPEAVDEP